MSQESNANGPKPLSPSAVLKLLRAAGQGSRIQLEPEHIAALDAAITALAFQYQVRQLVQHGPQALERPSTPREPRHDQREARPPRPSQEPKAPGTPPTPPRPAKVLPPRPTEGSGAIWTTEEEARLRGQWENGDAIGAIAENHKRSALACFARLTRVGAIEATPDTQAAVFLIKKQQLVQRDNKESWMTHALSLGFDPSQAEAPKSTVPAQAKSPSP